MSKTSKFFNELRNERNLKNEKIQDQNFQAFIEEFDHSQKNTPKTMYSLKDVENLLKEKAHNLKIYHNPSSVKNENSKKIDYFYENSKKKSQNKENRDPIYIDETEESEFFSKSNKKTQESMKKSEKTEQKFSKNITERGFDNNNGNNHNEKEMIWKRLQDDRKAERLKREALKKQTEEQEVKIKKKAKKKIIKILGQFKENCTFKPKITTNNYMNQNEERSILR